MRLFLCVLTGAGCGLFAGALAGEHGAIAALVVSFSVTFWLLEATS